MSVFAFAARANSPTEAALVHPAYELGLDVGNDAFLEPIAIGEHDATLGLADVDVEETSSVQGEEEAADCVLVVIEYEYEYEEWGDGYYSREEGYGLYMFLLC